MFSEKYREENRMHLFELMTIDTKYIKPYFDIDGIAF
jgi:hypothetical protein